MNRSFAIIGALAMASYEVGKFILPERLAGDLYYGLVLAVTTLLVWAAYSRRYGTPTFLSAYATCPACGERRHILNRARRADAFCSIRCRRQMDELLTEQAVLALQPPASPRGVTPTPEYEHAWRLWRRQATRSAGSKRAMWASFKGDPFRRDYSGPETDGRRILREVK